MKIVIAYLIVFFLYLLSYIPLKHLRTLANYLGKKALKNNYRIVHAITRNLRLCLPLLTVSEQENLKQQRLGAMVQTLLEMSHVWLKPVDDLMAITDTTNVHYDFLDQLESTNNNGCIVLAPHLGNWEVLNYYLTQRENYCGMYTPLKNPVLNSFIKRARGRNGTELIKADKSGVFTVLKRLKKNAMLMLLPDQVPMEGAGGFAPLFGQQAYTMTLAHKLALKTNAKVFIGAAYQTEKGFALTIQPMAEGFYNKCFEESATCLNQSIEHLVKKSPEQYQWEYKRFRVQPNGDESLYK